MVHYCTMVQVRVIREYGQRCRQGLGCGGGPDHGWQVRKLTTASECDIRHAETDHRPAGGDLDHEETGHTHYFNLLFFHLLLYLLTDRGGTKGQTCVGKTKQATGPPSL
jgi:hypothetical protein